MFQFNVLTYIRPHMMNFGSDSSHFWISITIPKLTTSINFSMMRTFYNVSVSIKIDLLTKLQTIDRNNINLGRGLPRPSIFSKCEPCWFIRWGILRWDNDFSTVRMTFFTYINTVTELMFVSVKLWKRSLVYFEIITKKSTILY